jgi:hypothetical protein
MLKYIGYMLSSQVSLKLRLAVAAYGPRCDISESIVRGILQISYRFRPACNNKFHKCDFLNKTSLLPSMFCPQTGRFPEQLQNC